MITTAVLFPAGQPLEVVHQTVDDELLLLERA
jgi:hypothetical protein